MEKDSKFSINHLTLRPGVYVSRLDKLPSGDTLTTFDIRLTAPNIEPAVAPEALHTIEHLAATFLRNHPQWGSRVVYWGPMGCCTGSYLILAGNYKPEDILDVLTEMMRYIESFEGDIPGASARECGNYKFNDLSAARAVARRFLADVLEPRPADRFVYPD